MFIWTTKDALVGSIIVFAIGYIVVGVIWDFVAKRIGRRKP